jgi:hypothetical protein
MRFVNATHGGIVFEKSAANVPCGATGSTWNTASPDLRIDNVTAHGSSPDGLLISVTGGRNVVLGGWDVGGHNSAPTGLGGTTTLPSVKFDGASADDVQDCRLGIALDGTPSIIDGSAGSYRIWLGNCRRCGWEGQPNNPVLFANTLGSRPEKCAWLAVSGGGVPGSETAVNTTPALVTTDNPCMRDGQAQNLDGMGPRCLARDVVEHARAGDSGPVHRPEERSRCAADQRGAASVDEQDDDHE